MSGCALYITKRALELANESSKHAHLSESICLFCDQIPCVCLKFDPLGSIQQNQPEEWEMLPCNQMQEEYQDKDLTQLSQSQMPEIMTSKSSSSILDYLTSGFNSLPQMTEVALNRVWRPFDDLAKEDRFLIPHIQATTMFNYYRLMEVEYTFLISGASYNTGWDAGPAVFRLLPWTGDFGSGTTTNYIQHCPLSPIVNTTGCTSERINPYRLECRHSHHAETGKNYNCPSI